MRNKVVKGSSTYKLICKNFQRIGVKDYEQNGLIKMSEAVDYRAQGLDNESWKGPSKPPLSILHEKSDDQKG